MPLRYLVFVGCLMGLVSPALADRGLAAAAVAYSEARQAEKQAKEELARAEAEVERARTEAAAAAAAQNARWNEAQQALDRAKAEALALLEERAAIQLRIAEARDRSREARRIYDDARPVYEVRGQTEQLADIPEWRAIERRASQTSADAQRVAREEQPKIDDVDRRLADKRVELQRLQTAANRVAELAPADPTRGWLRAAVEALAARRSAVDAEAKVAKAFDAYVARLGTTRPPFLEAVSANVGVRPLYDGVWRRDRAAEDPNERRRREIREALAELDPTISERERERENLRQRRYELAESMHRVSLAIVDYEARVTNAELNKIFFTALAEAAGTVVETALTGGVGPALRAAEAVAEKAIEDAAAKPLATRAVRGLEPEAAIAMRRLVQAGERSMASEGARLYQELEHLAHQAAVRQANRTGESVSILTLDAKRRLARALRDLASTDSAVRNEAMRAAEEAFGTKAKEIASALVQAGAGKPGSNALADLLLDKGSATRDTAGVVLGDTLEQGIARGTVYAFAVAPDAARAALAAARENAGRWRQITAGGATFLSRGRDLAKFKEAFGGTFRGNVVAVGTTAVKAAITKYFADQQYFWAEAVAALHYEWNTDNEMMQALMAGDAAIKGPLDEARRLQAELRAYLALLEGPRRLEPTDGDAEVTADSTIELTLRFSTELAATPSATLSGVALKLQPMGTATQTAMWKATLARRELPADVMSASLIVTVPESATPDTAFDSNPATPASPDPTQPIAIQGGRAVVAWRSLERGEDRHHTILLRDPWVGLWARGESRIRIARTGNALTGRLEKAGEPGRGERGFSDGAEVLRGVVVNHRQAQVEMLARYDREWRQRCPAADTGYWAKGEYTLDAATDRLTGTWEDRQLDEGCKVAETVTQKDALTRIPQGR